MVINIKLYSIDKTKYNHIHLKSILKHFLLKKNFFSNVEKLFHKFNSILIFGFPYTDLL